MLDSDNSDFSNSAVSDPAPTDSAPAETPAPAKAARKRPAKKAAEPATEVAATGAATPAPRKRPAKKAAAQVPEATSNTAPEAPVAIEVSAPPADDADSKPAKKPAKKAAAKKSAAKKPAKKAGKSGKDEPSDEPAEHSAPAMAAPGVLFVAPSAEPVPARRRRAATAPAGAPPSTEPAAAGADVAVAADDDTAEPEDVKEAAADEATGAARKRRRRGRRGRGGGGGGGGARATDGDDDESPEGDDAEADGATESSDGGDSDEAGEGSSSARRRRRRRRSSGGGADASEDDPPNTVVHVRDTRADSDDDGVRGVKGSTRLAARSQRRRDGRDTNRRRPSILTEAEFLARREAVDRVMAVRQNGDRTQIAVLEDNVLVEHYVTRASATSYVGNVYLGRVQNVLPSMEAAFVDIGKGRNGVLYAGEVNWDAAGLEGKSRAIENAMKSGDVVLVQVTKDPVGHKGARLTSQVSLPGRFLVYVPGGGMTGISRRLPDTERHRLKAILKKIVPEDAGVIVRTAAEGASEEDLTRDVERLQAEWASIQAKAQKTGSAPTMVHGEPDLAIRVVRDVFNEDFKKMTVQGDGAWTEIEDYITGVAPDLAERVSKHVGTVDLFRELRVDEQLQKALDRKVYLPSGGSLVIDRTEAMTVIDVNTGKFVGSGGNLEQTVTRNNLEAAEEIVRQLRLRDVGGIIVIDFIDMVLESNRELVLRRLTECLGRDRTKHQVAEVTSLGLVQMTRKRLGEGLLEAFSETCEHCHGRGVIIHTEPVDRSNGGSGDDERATKQGNRRRRGGAKAPAESVEAVPALSPEQRQQTLAAMATIHRAAHPDDELDLQLDDGLEADALISLAASDSDALAALAEAEVSADESEFEAVALSDSPTEPEQPELQQAALPADEQSADEQPVDAPEPEPVTAGPSRPRRRAATRPAGPPTTA